MKRKIVIGSAIILLLLFGITLKNREYVEKFEIDVNVPEIGFDINIFKEIVEKSICPYDFFGTYKITQFYPTSYYVNIKYDVLPDQEADMMLGQIITLKEDLMVTFDSERGMGTKDGRDGFSGNYILKKFIIENPQYKKELFNSDTLELYLEPDYAMEWAIGEKYFKKLKAVISITDSDGIKSDQYFYTLNEESNLIMFSGITGQYFLLEKTDIELEETSNNKEKTISQEFYGKYEIIQFLPTKFYPALDSTGCVILPQVEANMMLYQTIMIGEDYFQTYDNCRLPNSVIMQRAEDDFKLEEIIIQKPEYRARNMVRDEIYGLRDDMLPEDLFQKEYLEIDVYPGYEVGGEKILPQLFMVDDGEIIMYSMGEYFLLKKII
ncbi:MAG: hypothetical protein HDR71_04100 [Lachnospiraceae bacterium]|nr:hypothetical protein [Lachnospiraceae bacterium]